ncbi:MAG TPA: heme-binding beta-barrel domain-containing protein, partial [Acidimicrobiales bacterium]|nr:heme-binding beta-barrel domain-containing protein [Acidimicrobiales bacterium]
MSAGPEWGPLGRLAGIWEGDRGEDVAYGNVEDKIIVTPFREHIEFKPFGPVENGSQVLYGLDYRMAGWRGTEENPFHTEVGYWMWDARDSEVVRCFIIPRGSAVVAGGIVAADATKFDLEARIGSQT